MDGLKGWEPPPNPTLHGVVFDIFVPSEGYDPASHELVGSQISFIPFRLACPFLPTMM